MFLLVSRLAPTLGSASPWLTLPAAALTSIGTYTFLASAFSFLARRSRYLRGLLLGPADVEGTWVGYLLLTGEKYKVIEWIEQDIDSTVIRGQSFKPDGSYYCQWTSNAVNLDVERGILTYTYTCEILDSATVAPIYGISKFQLERRLRSHGPVAMLGFSTDEGFQGRVQAHQRRLSREMLTVDDALALELSLGQGGAGSFGRPAGESDSAGGAEKTSMRALGWRAGEDRGGVSRGVEEA